MRLDAGTSLYLESLVQLPVALLIIGWLTLQGTSQFMAGDWTERLLLMGSAPPPCCRWGCSAMRWRARP